MCFYNDDGWTADVEDETVGPATAFARCDECGCVIHKGQWLRHLFVQEHEECQECGVGHPLTVCGVGDEPHEPCADGDHAFGESYDWDCCDLCSKLLKAIKIAEEEDGCRGPETQPAFGQLYEAMTYEEDSAERYVAKAVEMFPELAASGHLGRFGEVWEPERGWATADLQPVDELGGEG